MMGHQGSIEQSVAIARDLRRNMTPAERKLWRALRALNADVGIHFRRQAPIGRFVADFCEHTRKIVIEVDGGQHGEPDGLARDAERTAWLGTQGYRVLRFSNTEVLTNLEGIMISVMAATGTLPADSSVMVDNIITPPPFSSKALARLARRQASAAMRGTPTPNPSPQGGGEFRRRSRPPQTDTSSPVVACSDPAAITSQTPSPLVGEGWGGGAAAATAGDVLPSKAPA